jgi:2-hydroxychromene-2-carboxylate isomerase
MPSVFPVNTIRALRGAVAALEEGSFSPYHHAVMEAYWAHDQDIGDAETLAAVIGAAGLDGQRLIARCEEAPIKAILKANTDEAITRGVFGAPTFFVGEQMFWGNDRLDFVAEALAERAGMPESPENEG